MNMRQHRKKRQARFSRGMRRHVWTWGYIQRAIAAAQQSMAGTEGSDLLALLGMEGTRTGRHTSTVSNMEEVP